MISIPIDAALLFYMAVATTTILCLWAVHHYFRKKKKITLAKDRLTRCEFCAFAYLAPRGKKVHRCPQCKSYSV